MSALLRQDYGRASRMMVEAHGGVIWVESKGEGLGSTFAFAIPLPPPPKDKSVIALEEMLG